MTFDLSSWRRRFPILERCVYLNNNSLGAMPARARDDLARYADLWAERGIQSWEEEWFAQVFEVSGLFARLIGAEPEEVMVNTCVSDAISVLASCLDYRERDKVVFTDLNFPTVIHLWERQRRRGARLHVIESADGITVPASAYEEAVDASTLVLPISHVFYRSGFIQDVPAIARTARARGAFVLLDAFQSVGSIPVDVGELGIDMLVAGSLKWLCGGPGVAFLYVRRELIGRLEPVVSGWLSRPDALRWLETGEPRAPSYAELPEADTSLRFLTGTPAVPALYAARAGLETVLEVGMEAIRERQLALQRRLQEGVEALELPLASPRDPERRSGMLTVRVEDGVGVTGKLLEEGFVVDHRHGAGIRVSPHFYNTEEEIDAFVEALGRIVRG
jgi:kynureninase